MIEISQHSLIIGAEPLMRNSMPANTNYICPLIHKTPSEWANAVLADFDCFLRDHAAAEKKASGMAVSMFSHYPDRLELVQTMMDLAIEELCHYREVIKILHSRGLVAGPDEKDHYVIEFRKHMRSGSNDYLMDRLLIGGLIEARGAERFALVAEALEQGKLKDFYEKIAESERSHFAVLRGLAYQYFDRDAVESRLSDLRPIESEIIAAQPLRAYLH